MLEKVALAWPMQNIYCHVGSCVNNIITWHYYFAFPKIGLSQAKEEQKKVPSEVDGDDHI